MINLVVHYIIIITLLSVKNTFFTYKVSQLSLIFSAKFIYEIKTIFIVGYPCTYNYIIVANFTARILSS